MKPTSEFEIGFKIVFVDCTLIEVIMFTDCFLMDLWSNDDSSVGLLLCVPLLTSVIRLRSWSEFEVMLE